MSTRLQLGLFPGGLFAAFKKLHWVSRHDGRYGVLIDKLGVPISPQQHAKIVEPGYHPLQFYAIDEKNCEGDFCFTYMIKEGVLQILCAIGCHGRFFRFLFAALVLQLMDLLSPGREVIQAKTRIEH
jgi:hypothetical protein